MKKLSNEDIIEVIENVKTKYNLPNNEEDDDTNQMILRITFDVLKDILIEYNNKPNENND